MYTCLLILIKYQNERLPRYAVVKRGVLSLFLHVFGGRGFIRYRFKNFTHFSLICQNSFSLLASSPLLFLWSCYRLFWKRDCATESFSSYIFYYIFNFALLTLLFLTWFLLYFSISAIDVFITFVDYKCSIFTHGNSVFQNQSHHLLIDVKTNVGLFMYQNIILWCPDVRTPWLIRI